MKKKFSVFTALNYLFFTVVAFISVVPIWLIASVALSTEADIQIGGFAFFPLHFTTRAFEYVFRFPQQLIHSFIATVVYSIGGSAISVCVMAMMGYVLTRPEFFLKKFCKIILVITMFFNAGIVPSYILNTQVYHLENTWIIYLLSGTVSAFTVFVFRVFFLQVPASLSESATIDGATSMQILFKIIIPLSKPILAAQWFLMIVTRWKDYGVTLYYITDKTKYTLEYYVQTLIRDAKMLTESLGQLGISTADIPSETMRFAICFLTIIPMIAIFPMFQKHFSKGAMVGAVKG